ncbi:7tm 7 domain containing protein, partial [Asbolus verrucosus]
MFSPQISNEQVELNAAGFFPINYTLVFSILGLVTFTHSESTFRPFKSRCIWSVLAIFIDASMVVYFVFKVLTLKIDLKVVYKGSQVLLVCFSGCYMVTTWICSIVKREQFIEFLVKIIDFDVKLHTHSITINYERSRRKILYQLVGRLVYLFLMLALTLIFSFLLEATYTIVGRMSTCILLIVNSATCHQSIELISMVRARFVILNKQIYNLAKSKQVTGKSTNRLVPLNHICALHHHLSKSITLFNSTFGLILLLMFGMSFVVIVSTIFYATIELQSSHTNWFILFYRTFSTLGFYVDPIYLCGVCYSTIEEANRSGELIHRIETEDHDVRDGIEMFSLQIANERVEFNAAGFFPVNYTLVF